MNPEAPRRDNWEKEHPPEHSPAPGEKSSRAGRVKFVFLVLFFAIMLVIGVLFLPRMAQLTTEQGRAQFIAWVRGKGAWGVLFFLLLQVMQVVSFLIPGEFFEIMGGALYGTVGGFFLCMAGVLAGSVIIFLLSRALGYEVVENLLSRKRLSRLQFLQKEGRLEAFVFFLFFIPGTPKDALTYFVPFTRMNMGTFLVLSSVARIPSVLSSTLVGSNLAQGNFVLSVLIYAVIGALGLAGMWWNKRLLDRKNQPQDGGN